MRRFNGFSLMEMMVVLLIVSIVAAAAAPMVNKKILATAGEKSPWVFTGNDQDIAYDIDNDSHAIIGGANPLNSAKLSIGFPGSNANGRPNPHIALSRNNNNNHVSLYANDDYLVFSSNIMNVNPPTGITAFGVGTQYARENATVYGHNALVRGENSVAVGQGAQVLNAGTAVGQAARAGINSTALGNNVEVRGESSVAVGQGIQVLDQATNSVAVGQGIQVAREVTNSVAVGQGIQVPQEAINSVAVGQGAQATAQNSTALGQGTLVQGERSVAVGQGAISTANNAISILGNAQAFSAIAIGAHINGQGALAMNSIALGTEAVANPGAGNSVAIGTRANVAQNATNSVAIGNNAQATAQNSVAIGQGAINTANNAISILGNAQANNAISIGANNNNNNLGARAISSIALGTQAVANLGATNSIAIGTQANVVQNATNSVAIGPGAVADTPNRIVLGRSGANAPAVVIPGNLIVQGNVNVTGETALGANTTVGGTLGVTGLTTLEGDVVSTNLNLTKDLVVEGSTYIHSGYGYYKLGAGNQYLYAQYTSIPSDRRLKNVGEAFTAGLEEIKKLEVFNYTFKKDESKTPRVGVMAQDLEKIFPKAVFKGEDGFLRIRMEDMFYALVNAVKQLDAKIEELKNNEILTLKNRLDDLEKANKELVKLNKDLQKQNEDLIKENKKFEKRLDKLEKKLNKKLED